MIGTEDEVVDIREIRRLVRKAWGEMDRDVLARFIDPEMLIVEPESLPYRGTFRGIDGYLELLRQINAVWEDLTLEEGDVVGESDGDALVIEYFTTARARATGKWIKRHANLAIWRFSNGKVISMTPFNFDTAEIVAALNPD